MLAQVNKTTAAVSVVSKTTTTTTARRGATIVRKNSKGGEEGAPSFGNDAYGMIGKAASYSLFGAAITKSGVSGEFTAEGPITVFAPNDDAMGDFAKAQGLSKVDLMSYDGLKDVVLNHIAKGKFDKAGLPAEVEMVSGKKVSTAGMSFKKNDIKVDNGLIHAISTVIV